MRGATTERTPTWDVLHTYPADYKVIFIGDAAMSPYEIAVPGGSVEHMNEEPGAVWIEARDRHLQALRLAQPGRPRHTGPARRRSS